ncbi:MAG: ABC transporter permease [Deltaproteobacteria bacterium]|jgi:phospholipid/cholesterol/gamma-HCH transport system permease protein|uniref:ABC transporter permease n=1 Tax=Candidatus Acidulodesulfobacterium acidiphilum TaxID=2597224 RepID=A0A520XFR4_9DELT|nr:ABC transporter permease [Deltaproteobacteria bacterium]RZV40047.1 MAG: ABC transporter permease [Candidatus Acidulodesulfobacterium acidiphilum]
MNIIIKLLSPFEKIGNFVIYTVNELGSITIYIWDMILSIAAYFINLENLIDQMIFIGMDSFSVIGLTGLFTGMVLSLQAYYAAKIVGVTYMIGPTVALSMLRELGPVLTALMITARCGSSMASEIGTMRVTEQIDALEVMAVDPYYFLSVPRILAAMIMLPVMAVLCSLIGIIGGYIVYVYFLGLNHVTYIDKIYQYVKLSDIYNGLLKAVFFGAILSVISTYKGFQTSGGAKGVGKFTTQAVVLSSIYILFADYLLTSILF